MEMRLCEHSGVFSFISYTTAFEYAVWAKDFKMVEMMLRYATPEIKAELLKQYQQITKPIEEGGGLEYTLTYDRPILNEKGIPIKNTDGSWRTERVTEERRENHFNLKQATTPHRMIWRLSATLMKSVQTKWLLLDCCLGHLTHGRLGHDKRRTVQSCPILCLNHSAKLSSSNA